MLFKYMIRCPVCGQDGEVRKDEYSRQCDNKCERCVEEASESLMADLLLM